MSADISKYYPDMIRDFREFIALAKVENTELAELWDDIEAALNNQFIQDGDVVGIKKFEELVDITSYASDTLAERKFRVMAKWNANLPYTEKRLIEMLDKLCGVDGYTLTIDRPNHCTVIKVALVSKKNENSVRDMAERVVPAEMKLSVSLLYNQHQTFRSYTHQQLQAYSHNSLREDVMEIGN
ncbi:hypothetical protein SDC9_133369 [bioreactor metagenome]|uniref:DUF2313 domain-containing protein n=1 Tax=bioreactor metagenome TaxID=1076179 RepID=A0A645D9S4_9ZZZZ